MVVGCGEIKSALAYDDGKGGCTSDLFDVNDVVCMYVCMFGIGSGRKKLWRGRKICTWILIRYLWTKLYLQENVNSHHVPKLNSKISKYDNIKIPFWLNSLEMKCWNLDSVEIDSRNPISKVSCEIFKWSRITGKWYKYQISWGWWKYLFIKITGWMKMTYDTLSSYSIPSSIAIYTNGHYLYFHVM